MEGFLGNTLKSVNGEDVYVGPTFGGESNRLSAVQSMVLEYKESLESKKVGGGY